MKCPECGRSFQAGSSSDPCPVCFEWDIDLVKKIRGMIFPGEMEFLNYVKSNSDVGFGRMMQIISFYWHGVDPVGALTSGECFGTLPQWQRDELEDLKTSDPLDYS